MSISLEHAKLLWKKGDKLLVIDDGGSPEATLGEVVILNEFDEDICQVIKKSGMIYSMYWHRFDKLENQDKSDLPLTEDKSHDFKLGDYVIIIKGDYNITKKGSIGIVSSISEREVININFVYLNSLDGLRESKLGRNFPIKKSNIKKINMANLTVLSKLNKEKGKLVKIENNRVYARWEKHPHLVQYLDMDVVEFIY